MDSYVFEVSTTLNSLISDFHKLQERVAKTEQENDRLNTEIEALEARIITLETPKPKRKWQFWK